MKNAADPNDRFNFSLKGGRVFTTVESRPLNCDEGSGLCTSRTIGQDFGDVFAQLAEGYNFDGIQSPVVVRQGDPAFDPARTVFSVANFYGAHGHDAELESMSATFLAAGPGIRQDKTVRRVRNIDVAPTIMHLLGVKPSPDVDGKVLEDVLR